MQLIVNGKPTEVERPMSIVDFLREKGVDESLVAIEHNLSWLRREQWSEIVLQDNDRVEVIRIMAGG